MGNVKQLRICGLGGQGLVLGGVIMGHAAIHDGKYVAVSESYGVRVRGGYVLSDIVISDRPIVYPRVLEADILIPLSQDAYDDHIAGVAPGGVVIYDNQLVRIQAREGLRQVGIPASLVAVKDIGQKQVANMVILGAAVAVAGIVTKASLRKGVEEDLGERYREQNLKAVELGYGLGEAHGG